MKRRRRTIEVFNLSFLDVVSCGFGAIILLLVIIKIAEPQTTRVVSRDLTEMIEHQKQELVVVRERSRTLKKKGTKTQQHLHDRQQVVTGLERARGELDARIKELGLSLEAQQKIESQLAHASQRLTEEMRQLHPPRPLPTSPIGGIPVDSEYIIFIIDTSGSMQRFAWPMVREKMGEILAIYPRVKGIQVLNDMGEYMFSQYAGKWIPDSQARRKAILRQLVSWTPFSNSSPVEGITKAISRFYSRDRKISLYVFGDDFSRGSIQEVVDTVNRLNRGSSKGEKRVRIHALGFPVLFSQPGTEANLARFSSLMRRLATDNNGSFVGLTSLVPARKSR